MNIALVILAAGSSSRLGTPKQLLRRGEQSMIEYIVSEASLSKLGPVYVITGKYHKDISQEIDNVHLLYNKNWRDGMSSSIAFAISNLNQESIDGAMIILSDQVYFDAEIAIKIADVAATNQYKIINCKYQKGMGPPTYFDSSLFRELTNLTGDQGAKSIIKKYQSDCLSIDFPKGDIDLDTQADIDILKNL